MDIQYKTIKDLPNDELYNLFLSVGWAESELTTAEMINNFNIGFLNSTFVVSAWHEDKLVGCARVLSDKHFRSILYDVAVLPEYQRKNIGKTMVERCFQEYPSSEWLVQTDKRKDFYQTLGFKYNTDDFLTKPGKYSV